MINPAKLATELLAAGLPVCSVRETGMPVADYTRALTPAEQATAAAVIAAHDPTPVPVVDMDAKVAALEKEVASLKAALIAKAVLTTSDIGTVK